MRPTGRITNPASRNQLQNVSDYREGRLRRSRCAGDLKTATARWDVCQRRPRLLICYKPASRSSPPSPVHSQAGAVVRVQRLLKHCLTAVYTSGCPRKWFTTASRAVPKWTYYTIDSALTAQQWVILHDGQTFKQPAVSRGSLCCVAEFVYLYSNDVITAWRDCRLLFWQYIIIISLIRQVGSNKSKIQIKYKIQNKQTTIKTEHANIPIKLRKLKKIY